MSSPFMICIIGILLCCCSLLESQADYVNEIPHRRFEYKYSFKGPYLSQKDGTVPFWEYSGSSIASEDMVRITPSLRSKKGQIWTKHKTTFDWWEVEIMFRVNGKGRIGADGLAFWFTDQKYPEGPVFGSADHWRGLALFFDSFDNDNKGNNPYIMAMVNDGTKSYDHNTDGINQQMQGCLRDFRNKPFPVRAKIEYFKNVLTVSFHSGNTNNENDFELCLRSENVYLPQFGHFGISAATGGLADDHDVFKFLTYSLLPPSQVQANAAPAVPMSRQEVESILNVQREVLQNSREIKVLVQHGSQNAPVAGQPHPGSQDSGNQQLALLQQLLGEVRENMNVVRREFGSLATRLAGGGGAAAAAPLTGCPNLSCTSSTTLIIILSVQSLILIGSLYYLNIRDSNQTKKFY
ncbi:hypothetical protein RDWZM_001558 [Blomia tropicalis]|uniref:L-type lectin-like domain-containing protein n=1 Tax=Blomia tropicalis TaxID=40697 RepID=A0A9Q0RP27_BLOTA|nr:hypothetical protein RDWZM_001558 [Blomia tropicalis]